MFVSFKYSKDKLEPAKRDKPPLSDNTQLSDGSRGSSSSSSSTPDQTKLYTTTLKIKNTDILKKSSVDDTEPVEPQPYVVKTDFKAIADKIFNRGTPSRSLIVSFTYNRKIHQEALEAKTSQHQVEEQSAIKLESESTGSKGNSSDHALIKSNSSSPKKRTKPQSTPVNSALSRDPIKLDEVSESTLNDDGTPNSVSEVADSVSPSKIVKVRYLHGKKKQGRPAKEPHEDVIGSDNVGYYLDPTVPNTRVPEEIRNWQALRETSIKTASDYPAALVNSKPRVENKMQQGHKDNSQVRPSSTSSKVSTSGLLHPSSSSISRASTPASSSSLSTSSSPSPTPLPESEPIAPETSDVLVNEYISDTSERPPRREPKRSTIHTCEEALKAMSQYSDLQTDITNSSSERDDLNSYQQVEIDWFKSLIVVAEKLNDLKDTYRTIQLMKRKKASS